MNAAKTGDVFTTKTGTLRKTGECASWLRLATYNKDVTCILCMNISALLVEI